MDHFLAVPNGAWRMRLVRLAERFVHIATCLRTSQTVGFSVPRSTRSRQGSQILKQSRHHRMGSFLLGMVTLFGPETQRDALCPITRQKQFALLGFPTAQFDPLVPSASAGGQGFSFRTDRSLDVPGRRSLGGRELCAVRGTLRCVFLESTHFRFQCYCITGGLQ